MAAQQAVWFWLPCYDIVWQRMLLMMDEDAAPRGPVLLCFILQTGAWLLVFWGGLPRYKHGSRFHVPDQMCMGFSPAFGDGSRWVYCDTAMSKCQSCLRFDLTLHPQRAAGIFPALLQTLLQIA